MARPREFNADEALDRAMEVFWAKGYEATSLRDLVAAMGISKSSLYDTFGSKHELFLAAIDRYNATVGSCHMPAIIESAPTPRRGIADAFAHVIDEMTEKGNKRGCFVNNCAVEVASHDASAARRIAEGLDHLEETFHRAIRRGQELGEIGRHSSARALARYLTGVLNGMLVMGKAKPDRRALRDVARVALSALD